MDWGMFSLGAISAFGMSAVLVIGFFSWAEYRDCKESGEHWHEGYQLELRMSQLERRIEWLEEAEDYLEQCLRAKEGKRG